MHSPRPLAKRHFCALCCRWGAAPQPWGVVSAVLGSWTNWHSASRRPAGAVDPPLARLALLTAPQLQTSPGFDAASQAGAEPNSKSINTAPNSAACDPHMTDAIGLIHQPSHSFRSRLAVYRAARRASLPRMSALRLEATGACSCDAMVGRVSAAALPAVSLDQSSRETKSWGLGVGVYNTLGGAPDVHLGPRRSLQREHIAVRPADLEPNRGRRATCECSATAWRTLHEGCVWPIIALRASRWEMTASTCHEEAHVRRAPTRRRRSTSGFRPAPRPGCGGRAPCRRIVEATRCFPRRFMVRAHFQGPTPPFPPRLRASPLGERPHGALRQGCAPAVPPLRPVEHGPEPRMGCDGTMPSQLLAPLGC